MDDILSFWQSDDLMNNWRPIKNPDTQQCSMMFGLFVIALSFFPELVSMIIFSPRANNVEINLLILEKNVKTPNKYEIEATNGDYIFVGTSNFYYLVNRIQKTNSEITKFYKSLFFVVIGSLGKNNLIG